MGILDIFKSKKRLEYEYFKNILDISTEIFEMIKRKKELSDIESLDFDFDIMMNERIIVLSYFNKGILDFLDESYRNEIYRVFISDDLNEEYKRDLKNSYHFLLGFTQGMTKTVNERRKNLSHSW